MTEQIKKSNYISIVITIVIGGFVVLFHPMRKFRQSLSETQGMPTQGQLVASAQSKDLPNTPSVKKIIYTSFTDTQLGMLAGILARKDCRLRNGSDPAQTEELFVNTLRAVNQPPSFAQDPAVRLLASNLDSLMGPDCVASEAHFRKAITKLFSLYDVR